jgi:hypothetical protein
MDTKLHAIIPTICPEGARSVAPGIMTAAEKGATVDDFRAARAGLITPGTPMAGRGKTVRAATPDVRDIIARERAARERQQLVLRIARAMREGTFDINDYNRS